MNITWGTPKGAKGSTQIRVGIGSSVPALTAGSTDVTITTEIWVWTRDHVSDSSSLMTVSGTAVPASADSIAISTPSDSNWSTKNQKLVKTVTRTVPTTYSAQTLTASVSLTGVKAAGSGTVVTATIDVLIPARPFYAPAAPTGISVERGSDALHTIRWTLTDPASESAPVQSVAVQRYDGNAWVQIAMLGAASSFSDTSTVADRMYTWRVQAINSGGASAWLTSTAIGTTPKATSISVTADRPGKSIDLTISHNSTIATSMKVWHQSNGGAWTLLATLAATATSYTHVNPDATQQHVYGIELTTATRASGIVATSNVMAALRAPNAPTQLSPAGVTSDPSQPISLGWLHGSSDGTTATAYRVRWSEAGPTSAWVSPAGQALSGTSNGSTLIACPAHHLALGDTVTFAGALPSPLAAGRVYWASSSALDSFSIAATEQDAKDGIFLTVATGTFTVNTGRIVSNAGAHTLPGGTLAAGKVYQWQCSTQGKYDGLHAFGPWSAVATFRTSSRPTVTINYPVDQFIDTTRAMVNWGFYSADSSGQGWWQALLYREGVLVEVVEGQDENNTVTFREPLANGLEYRIDVVAENEFGITSDVASVTFTPQFLAPDSPGMELLWNAEDGHVVVDVKNPVNNGLTVVSNRIERQVGAGPWTMVADNVPPDTTLIDYLPHVNKVSTYRVIATTNTGTTSSYTTSITCDNSGDWHWLNGGPGWSHIGKVRYEASTSTKFGLDKVLNRFAGRTRPVESSGTVGTYEVSLSAVLPRDEEGYEVKRQLIALAELGGPVFYRNPQGLRMKCSLSDVSFSDQASTIQFQATLTEVA